jgi:hypothetical protein
MDGADLGVRFGRQESVPVVSGLSQSSDKRPCFGEAGVSRSAFKRRFIWRGCYATRPSTAQLLWVGSHRSPLLLSALHYPLLPMPFGLVRLISTAWLAEGRSP